MNETLEEFEKLTTVIERKEKDYNMEDEAINVNLQSHSNDGQSINFGEKVPSAMINNIKRVMIRKVSMGEKFQNAATTGNRKSAYSRKSSFYNMNSLANILSSGNMEDKENLRLAAIYVMNKHKRSVAENNVLAEYLKTLKPLIDMLNKDVSDKNFEDLLKNISFHLKYIFAEKNQVLFRFGDFGDLFYLILRGKVGIFIPKDEKVMMTEEEYLIYLIKLRKYREIGLLNSCLIKNRTIYRIEEENFDDWVYSVLDDEEILASLPKKTNNNKLYSFNSIRSFMSRKIPNYTNEKIVLKNPKKTNRIKKLLKAYLLELYDVISINNDLKPDIVSPEEYIQRSKPDKITDHAFLSTEKKTVTIWCYSLILSLDDGKKFGDFALEVTGNQKRTASVISLEPTHFGSMEKASYLSCIREVAEKVKRANVNFIVSQQIFSNCNRHVFLKSYYNFLVLRKIEWKEKVTVEGGDADKIIILKDGEYLITMKKSNLQINDIIKAYNGGSESHITEEEREEYWSDGIKFHKFMSEKKFTKLSILKTSDVFGLKDFVMDGKYLFTIECLSTSGEVYEIKNEVFLDLCKIDEDIRRNTKVFEEKKIKHLLKRMNTIKKQRIDSYKSFKKILEEDQKEQKFKKISLIVGSKYPYFDIEKINHTLVNSNGLSIGQAPENSSYELKAKKDNDFKPVSSIITTNNFATINQSNVANVNHKNEKDIRQISSNNILIKQKALSTFDSKAFSTSKTIKEISNKVSESKNKFYQNKNLIVKNQFKSNIERNGLINSIEMSHISNQDDRGEVPNKKTKDNRIPSSEIYEVFASGKISKLPKFEARLLAGTSLGNSTIMNTVNTIHSNNYDQNHLVESPKFQTMVKKHKSMEDSQNLKTFHISNSNEGDGKFLSQQMDVDTYPYINTENYAQNKLNICKKTFEEKYKSLNDSIDCKKENKNNSVDFRKNSLHLYEEIGKLSRNINKIIKKSHSRSLFDKILHNYLDSKTDPGKKNKIPSKLGSYDNLNNVYYNMKILPDKEESQLKLNIKKQEEISDTINNKINKEKPNKTKIINKNKNINNKHIFNSLEHETLKEENANYVDCLVMDNFNRLYNTIYYYSDIFTTDKLKINTNDILSNNKLAFNNARRGKEKVNYHRSTKNNQFLQQIKNSSKRLKIASMK